MAHHWHGGILPHWYSAGFWILAVLGLLVIWGALEY